MIIARAPLRISLGGGGTDLESYYQRFGGFILSAAIDKYVFISLNRLKTEDCIRLKYSQTEVVNSISEIKHPLLREALALLDVGTSLEIAAMADVPAGTGLGSSGAFVVSLLTALHAHKRQHLPTQALAEEACHVEIDLAHQPVGKHDQYLAAFGGVTCLDIGRDGAVTVRPLRISADVAEELQASILLYFTGVVRDSFGILDEQRRQTLEDDPSVIESLHTTKEIGHKVERALELGDVPEFGRLLHMHWENKKRRSSRISDDRIDAAYERARSNGALGGKLMGAGGGGFLMLCAPRERKAQVRGAMIASGLREMSFHFDYEGAKVVVNV